MTSAPQMSCRDKRINAELGEYPLMLAPPKPWGEVLSLSVPAYHLRVDVTHHYPFRPPIFHINGANALHRVKQMYVDVLVLLRKYQIDLPCVCCRIFLSETCWTPAMKIEQAVDDYLVWSSCLEAVTKYCGVKDALPFDDLIHTNILSFFIPKKK